jgi:hypothetical protein
MAVLTGALAGWRAMVAGTALTLSAGTIGRLISALVVASTDGTDLAFSATPPFAAMTLTMVPTLAADLACSVTSTFAALATNLTCSASGASLLFSASLTANLSAGSAALTPMAVTTVSTLLANRTGTAGLAFKVLQDLFEECDHPGEFVLSALTAVMVVCHHTLA